MFKRKTAAKDDKVSKLSPRISTESSKSTINDPSPETHRPTSLKQSKDTSKDKSKEVENQKKSKSRSKKDVKAAKKKDKKSKQTRASSSKPSSKPSSITSSKPSSKTSSDDDAGKASEQRPVSDFFVEASLLTGWPLSPSLLAEAPSPASHTYPKPSSPEIDVAKIIGWELCRHLQNLRLSRAKKLLALGRQLAIYTADEVAVASPELHNVFALMTVIFTGKGLVRAAETRWKQLHLARQAAQRLAHLARQDEADTQANKALLRMKIKILRENEWAMELKRRKDDELFRQKKEEVEKKEEKAEREAMENASFKSKLEKMEAKLTKDAHKALTEKLQKQRKVEKDAIMRAAKRFMRNEEKKEVRRKIAKRMAKRRKFICSQKQKLMEIMKQAKMEEMRKEKAEEERNRRREKRRQRRDLLLGSPEDRLKGEEMQLLMSLGPEEICGEDLMAERLSEWF